MSNRKSSVESATIADPRAYDIHRPARTKIDVCRPMLPKLSQIVGYLKYIDEGRYYSNQGNLLLTLQDRLRASTRSAAYAAAAASGTAALAAAILVYAGRAKPSRPLCFVPSYTFVGTVSAIEQCGYTPYFLDIDPLTWMIEPEKCAGHPRIEDVGLVLPVALYGRAIAQADWSPFSRKTGVPVVIDGAAALESLVDAPERRLGPIPVAVSFHATKSFGVGEGGAVFCDDADHWRAIMQTLNFGCDTNRVCHRTAINGKMSEYHAAVGLAELDGWTAKLAAFRSVAARYGAGPAIAQDRLHLAPSVASCYCLYEARDVGEARAVRRTLAENGIGCRDWYGPGAHRQPYCESFPRDATPVADDLADRLIGLPMSVDLSGEEIDAVLATVDAALALA